MKNQTKSKLGRRNFLLAVGVGGAAAAGAIAARAIPGDASQAVASDDKRRGKGYHESAHVRSDHKTAKV